VSVLNEMTLFTADKILVSVNRSAGNPTSDRMEVFSRLPDELQPAYNTSDTVGMIDELCLKPALNVVRLCVFFQEKPSNHLLLVLSPASKI
jgi:hypothetical protein